MSGIEICGLVLGALPLLVKAIESCNEIRSVAQRLFYPGQALRSLCRKLKVELQEFQDTALILLLSVTDEHSARSLIADPGSDAWNNLEFESKLKAQLSWNYETWYALMEDVDRAIKDIRVHLRLGSGDLSHTAIPTTDMVQTLKVGFGKSKIDAAMGRIESSNRSFKRLTGQAIKLATQLDHRRCRPPNFKHLRATATHAFFTVDTGLLCPCKSSHILCLGLQSMHTHLAQTSQNGNANTTCGHRVVLATRTVVATSSQTHYVAEIEVVNAMTGTAGVRRKLKNQQSPQSSGSDAECLKALIRSGMVTSSTSITTPSMPARQTRLSIIPVAALFPNKQGQKGKLRDKARRRIALVAASSLLQLYDTPWLPSPTFKNQIGLIRGTDGDVVPILLIQKEPQPPEQTSKQASFADPMDLKLVRNEWVYGLGVFLIELCLGKTIAELHEPQDNVGGGMLPQLVEFQTVSRVFDRVLDRGGHRYAKAVKRCIWCEFDDWAYDLGSESFCKAVFKDVVDLLREDVEQFEGRVEQGDQVSGQLFFASKEPMCW